MKRTITAIILAISMLSLTACGSSGSSSIESTTTTSKIPETPSSTTTTTTSAVSSVATSSTKISPKYIGDRGVCYYEARNLHTAFWSFSETKSGERLAIDAVITLKIVNDNGEVVYDKSHTVSERNYTNATNSSWDSPRLLGYIEIPQSDIMPGTESDGILYISASIPEFDSYFDSYGMNIDNLPLKEIDISIPELPLAINNYSYDDEIKQTLEIMSTETEYDGENFVNGRLTLKIKVKMTYNKNGTHQSDGMRIGYKLKDSEGIVINSGSISVDPIAVGDITITEENFYDLKLGESYTLEFIDVR